MRVFPGSGQLTWDASKRRDSVTSCHAHLYIQRVACVRRAPNLKRYFLDLCSTTEEALAIIQRLTSDLLDSEENKLGWRGRITTLETRLNQRLPSLDQATALAQDVEGEQRALKIAHAIGREAVRLQGAHTSRRGPNGENEGLHTLHDDEIKEAILSESYRNCEQAVRGIDSNTSEGRRKILETCAMSGNSLILRVMMRGQKELARRDRLLALILEARGGNGLTGLIDYLSHAHAVDPSTGIVPQRRRKFSVAGETGVNESELRKFILCKFKDMNWYCTKTGIYALRICDTGANLLPLDDRDRLVVISELDDFIKFGEIRMLAAGFPAVLPQHYKGWTWRSFWSFYVDHLKLAKLAGSRTEMLQWVSQAAAQGEIALRLIGEQYRMFLESATPSQAKLLGVLPEDNSVVENLRTWQKYASDLQNARDIYKGCGIFNPRSDPINTYELPRLSTTSAQRILEGPAAKKQKVERRQVTNQGLQGKGRWLSPGRKYLKDGWVWNVAEAKREFPDLCFEFLVGEKCSQGLSEGHGFAGDTAHSLPM